MPKIEIDVVGNVSSLGRELQRGAGQVRGFASQTGSVLKGVLGAKLIGAGVGAAVDGVRALGGVLKDSVGEARESQKVGAVTAQVIKATGGAAKISASQVGDLTTRLSNKAGVDDELIQSGANLLLTFKNVRNEAGKGGAIFDRATAAAVDLSATGFGSVTGSSKMLGKALNDPVKGISALSKAGVTFTDQQKDQIKTLTASGDVLGAQKIILGEVEAQVGGVAAAQATAGEKAKVMGDNLKEQLGTALLPTLDKLAGFFTSTLGPAISTGIGYVTPLLASVTTLISPLIDRVIGLATGITTAFAGGGGGISALLSQLQPVGAAVLGIVAVVGPALLGIVTQVGGLAQALLPTILAVATAVGPVVAGIVTQLAGLVQSVGPQIAGLLATVGGVVAAVLPGIAGVVSAVVGVVRVVVPIVLQVFGAVAQAIQANLPALISAFASIRSTVTSVVSIITSVWSKLGPVILPIIKAVFGTAVQVISGALKIVSGIFKTISAVLRGDWSGAWNGIKQIASGAVQIVTGIVKGLASVLKAIWSGIKSAASSIWNAVKSAASAAWAGIVGVITDKTAALLSTVRGIPGKIKAALSGLAGLLVGSGKAMLSGLAQGIRDGIGAAIGAAKDAVSAIRAFFPGSPAKKGPFSGSGWTLYSGRAIGASMGQGMLDTRRDLVRTANALAVAARPDALVGRVGPASARRPVALAAPAAMAVASSATAFDAEALAAAVQAGIIAGLTTLDPRGEHALVTRGMAYGRARGGQR